MDEYSLLKDDQRAAVDQAVDMVVCNGSRQTVAVSDGGEAYAYPHPAGGVSWGVNSGETGHCIARGVVRV